MSKTKTRPSDLADSRLAKQAGLSLLGVAVGAGSRSKKLPKDVRGTLKSLREVIADAEKTAGKEAKKRRAQRARKRLIQQLQASAKDRSKSAAKSAAATTAKASAKTATAGAKAGATTAKVGAKAAKTAKKTSGPVLLVGAAETAKKKRRGRKS